MPELPEVETTKEGISPYIISQKINKVVVRNPKLRWPVPSHLKKTLAKEKIKAVTRRGKYLIIHCNKGSLLLHLGMSGKLAIVDQKAPLQKHDHVTLELASGKSLRLNDPRRFGAVLWTSEDPNQHKLLADLGPEPLSREFNAHYLTTKAKRSKKPIKTLIMDSHVVVGVGNIYANEALFMTKIHPLTPSNTLTEAQCQALSQAIKKVLKAAIKVGGTTLKDFLKADGKPGYFSIKLKAYGRAGEPCVNCKTVLKEIRLGGRTTVFCPKCQKPPRHCER